jgi:transcriptional regulator with XRE-family HTH domain
MTASFGGLLRTFRKRAKLTQTQLAERAQLGERTVGGLERGEHERLNPSADTLNRLANALELSESERAELFAAAARSIGSGVNGETGVSESSGAAPVDLAVAPALSPGIRPLSLPRYLTDAADELAGAVRTICRRAYRDQQVHDPFPLPVRWTQKREHVSDHVENIHAVPPGVRAEQTSLVGAFNEITDLYQRLPSGRLVILGAPGSGKTMLARRFVLDMLRDSPASQPVPVMVGIGSWDPLATPFENWLIDHLVHNYPHLAGAAPRGSALGAELVERDAVLPVLDGFDEMAGALRGPALRALNRTEFPLVLTSRPEEYENAVSEADVLTAGAVVELEALTKDDLIHYLPRTAAGSGTESGSGPETVWAPILTGLQQGSNDHASKVAAALSTPLMVSLARTIYSDTPGRSAAYLLEPQFKEPEDIEDHLLAAYVPTVYGKGNEPARHAPSGAWDYAQVSRWLNYLARHCQQLNTSDIAWWQLGTAMRLRSRAAVVALLSGLAVMLVSFVISFPMLLLADDSRGFLELMRVQILSSLISGAVVGPILGLVYAVARRYSHIRPEPARIRWRNYRRGMSVSPAKLRVRVMIGAVGGFAFGAILDLLIYWQSPIESGITVSAAISVAVVIASLLEAPVDTNAVADPITFLRATRRTVLIQMAIGAAMAAFVVGLGSRFFINLLNWLRNDGGQHEFVNQIHGVANGISIGLGAALAFFVTLTAWGQWIVLARVWLPLTGRLPWNLLAFLEDAYKRGVLRQSGSVYQFRHERLQRHLTELEQN